MRKTGLVLAMLAHALLLYTALASPSYARGHPHLDPVIVGEYTRPWPLALTGAFVLAGVMLVLIPARHGEAWAVWTSLGMFVILLATRLATDPRCLMVLDPHQHGCHTFMIAVVLGVTGLALVGRGAVHSEGSRAGKRTGIPSTKY